jgi:hypothetical protein
LGRYADLIDVDSLTLRGDVFAEIVIRAGGLDLGGNETRCYPIIRYKSVGPDHLRNLKLSKYMLTSDDDPRIDGVYYLTLDFDDECKIVSLCVSPEVVPYINRLVHIPEVAGVTSYPPAGTHYVKSHNDFAFSVYYTTPQPLAVFTNRVLDGVPEAELVGAQNENGEYEYVIRDVRENIFLSIGPGFASANGSIDEENTVWSHNNKLYIKVERADIASIYSIAGQLVKRIEVPEGNTSVPMARGVYVITLKDGAVHKVIVK